MRSLAVLVLMAGSLMAGCVVDGLDPSFGTLEDLVDETTTAIGDDGDQEYRSVDCQEEVANGSRQVASIRFRDVTDVDAALDSIFLTWSASWPDSAERESDERITVMTDAGTAAATLFDEDGVLRVDLVGPCLEP